MGDRLRAGIPSRYVTMSQLDWDTCRTSGLLPGQETRVVYANNFTKVANWKRNCRRSKRRPYIRKSNALTITPVFCFCSLAVLDPRVGHTMNVLSPFIHVFCQFDWLFHGESCPRLDVYCCPSRPCVAFLACMHLALFLALSFSSGNSLVSSWCDYSMLASLLWRCLTVPSLLQLC